MKFKEFKSLNENEILLCEMATALDELKLLKDIANN